MCEVAMHCPRSEPCSDHSKIHATSWAHPNEEEVAITYVCIQLTMCCTHYIIIISFTLKNNLILTNYYSKKKRRICNLANLSH